jgi:hypothetical protein
LGLRASAQRDDEITIAAKKRRMERELRAQGVSRKEALRMVSEKYPPRQAGGYD